jgi:hypothetical protein
MSAETAPMPTDMLPALGVTSESSGDTADAEADPLRA